LALVKNKMGKARRGVGDRSGISLFLGVRVGGYLSLVFKIRVRWETFKFGVFFREPSEKVNTAKSQKLIVFQSKTPTLTQTMTSCQGGSRKI
jgi:hypothetical protein